MNRLRKKRVGFVLQKRGKKRGMNAEEQRRKGDFMNKRTQFSASFEGESGDPVLKLVEGLAIPLHYQSV